MTVGMAVVLNAGSSWAAYQVGALRALADTGRRVDLWAGSGIGAMNATLAACGEVAALEEFWDGLTTARLLALSRRPWRGALFTGAPQRRFLRAHVSDARLAARDTRVLVSTMDLGSGRIEVLSYPGADVPLADGVMAAVATPGLVAPRDRPGGQLAEGTFVDSLLMEQVLAEHPAEVVLVAPVGGAAPGAGRYLTWHAVGARALSMNQAEDVRRAIQMAGRTEAAAAAFRAVGRLPERLASIAPAAVRQRVADEVGAVYAASAFPLGRAPGPRLVSLTADVGYPLWRFRPAELASARALGEADAHAALAVP
jgi:predicted acylesterase/phospholipase RssA